MTQRWKQTGTRPWTRREWLSAAGASGLVAAGSPAFGKPPAAPIGAWTPMNDLPMPIQEVYPTEHRVLLSRPGSAKPQTRSLVVVAGGFTPAPGFANNVSDRVFVLDPVSGVWNDGPRLPQPMHHVALVSNSGRIFAIGGFTADRRARWRMVDTVLEADDIERGVWRGGPSLPFPLAESVAVSLNGRVHIVGGRSPAGSANGDWGNHIDTDKHFAFVSGAGRWIEMAPLPAPRNSAAGAVYGSALYVIGGRTVSGGNTRRVDVYDPLSNRWQDGAPLPKSKAPGAPSGLGGHAAATYGGKIYACGGEWFGASGGGVYAEVFEYDPREDKWRGVAAMARPRHGLGAVALADGVYAIGGASEPSGNGTSGAVDRFSI